MKNLSSFIVVLTVLSLSGIQCKSSDHKTIFTFRDVIDYSRYRWDNDSSILVFSGNLKASLKTVSLKPGRYTITFKAEGNIAQKGLPNFSISFGELKILNQEIKEGINVYKVNFEIQKPMSGSLGFAFTNDYSSPTEDRNIFQHFPVYLNPY